MLTRKQHELLMFIDRHLRDANFIQRTRKGSQRFVQGLEE